VDHAKRSRALIIAGGNPVRPEVADRAGIPAWVVAADSGLDQATRLAITPNLIVGDLDSVDPHTLAAAEAAGIAVQRYPRDKDATDLELAIDAVVAAGYAAATIIGGTGGRMAHTLANALLLTRERRIELDWVTSHARISALFDHQRSNFAQADGVLLSVLPVTGPARCESTGLRWPLAGAPLQPGATRGVSNEIVATTASITVISGTFLVVHEKD
jgi:thiamine pyrophosphokinase